MSRRWIIFTIASSHYFLSQFYRVSNAVIAPELIRDLSLDTEGLGLLSAAFFYGFAFAQIPISLLLDKVGPRLMMTVLSLLGILGALVFSMADALGIVIVASLVIVIDQVLQAWFFEISRALSVFVGLIITNCIIMGRFEAFALGNGPWRSFLDGVGNALGYGWILIVVGFFRELLGSGTVWGYPIMEKLGLFSIGYENNGMMILPPMALITVGIIIWVQRSRTRELIEEN